MPQVPKGDYSTPLNRASRAKIARSSLSDWPACRAAAKMAPATGLSAVTRISANGNVGCTADQNPCFICGA